MDKVSTLIAEINSEKEKMGTRTWFEFIKSEANPSDGYTRHEKMQDIQNLTKAKMLESKVPEGGLEARNFVAEAAKLVQKAKLWKEFPEVWHRVKEVYVEEENFTGWTFRVLH